MNTKNKFIFTDFIQTNIDDFSNFNSSRVNENLISGSFDFNGLSYIFAENIKENLILFTITLMIETNTKKTISKIKKSIQEANKLYINVKISLDDLNNKDKTAIFRLSCAALVESSIGNPGAIVKPAVNSLPIIFMSIKEEI
ncbi:hypothetical protein FAH67_04670 [Neisseria flavescens]|uniref:Uncharacterized protein n=1 Tax=Neisseria flavescens NRL30031/H210 TaxID=546264 RepID=C0EJY7_NEIFL|nr:hypothetical protein [Neisseria flavescens]SPY04418.1 Uncharacterised protein [Neisseria meningitidis]EEG34610.1 hypothetical protein NEIFLAOT_00226 [Neisseria flavescens NRL30031/H210]QCL68774.1 hypothetical protein FAH67_04670 [Neisseria flavescens]SPY09485.1 Uncharacterised protein [Neisseria meningitidis]STZ65239.1 Uncharacterised protein [Neisseria flavescens]